MKTKQKKKAPAKSPIKIRYRKLKDGRSSIYLDSTVINLETGDPNVSDKHTYSFLNMYLVPEKTPLDARENKQTMQLVEEIVKQRTEKFNKERLNVKQRHSSKESFIDFLTRWMEQAVADGKTTTSKEIYKVRLRLIEFGGEDLAFSDITKDFITDFIDYLKTVDARCHYELKVPKKLKPKTISTYYDYFRSAINKAYKLGYLVTNPTKQYSFCEHVKLDDNEREFLEIPELRVLMKLPTKYDLEKRAFIFASLCGLRSSDIRNLRWSTFNHGADGKVTVCVRMDKTDELLYIPISANAMKWLPERGDAPADARVFPLIGEGKVNAKLQKMMDQLHIDKHITFHCSRHTFATMMLTLGADLYTVSKLMGHGNIEITQVYARIIDKKKDNAIDLIPSLTPPQTSKAANL